MPRTVITCLWAGHDLPGYSSNRYGVEDVLNLWRGVQRHIPGSTLLVLCDEHYERELTTGRVLDLLEPGEKERDGSTRIVRFQGHGIGGWSNVLEAFRPDLHADRDPLEPVLLVGLDTVFVEDCSWLFGIPMHTPADVLLPPDPVDPMRNPPCDAVVLFNKKGADLVWQEYLRAKAQITDLTPFPHLYNGRPSEMVLLQHLWKKHKWPMLEAHPKKLLSYKQHVRYRSVHVPEGCSIVYFHGVPKPRDLDADDPVRRLMA